jgi:hypothetical protein
MHPLVWNLRIVPVVYIYLSVPLTCFVTHGFFRTLLEPKCRGLLLVFGLRELYL